MKGALFIAVVICSAGCVSTPPPPAKVAHVQLRLVDSPLIVVSKAWLEQADGSLVVAGYVLRGAETTNTSGTHLDVTVFDDSGRVLQQVRGNFEPRQIRRRYRMTDYAKFRIRLDLIVRNATSIQVRAHEGAHSE